MTEPTPTAMLIDGFFTARDARGLGPWDPPCPGIEEFWPLPNGARVIDANPVSATVHYPGQRLSRWIGVQVDLSKTPEWNRARNAAACDARDRILAAVESGDIVLGEPISEPDSYPDEDPAEYSDELNFFC